MTMEFLTDNQLANYVTMRVGGPAKKLAVASSEEEVEALAKYASDNNLPVITLGWGSNIIFSDSGFDGLVIINKIDGIDLDEQTSIVTAGSGVTTDDVIKLTAEKNLIGIEALSKIPGVIGAAPVNNIGAYGQEISDTLVSVRAYDTATKQFVEISKNDCQFGYRESIFKAKEHGRYIITKVKLQLKPCDDDYQPPNYPALQAWFNEKDITKPTPKDVREGISELRQSKLPDSKELPNSGSFYKNPFVDKTRADELLAKYPDMPHFAQPDGTEKLSAAWLIDSAGLKDYRQNGFWVYDKQPLVLVNEKSTSFNDLKAISDHIISTVQDKFGVKLEIEPEVI